MTLTAPNLPDECLRCGYSLHGIENAQACPECGLVAERSRRVSDELYDTRPRWLGNIAAGVWMLLLAILLAVATPFVLAGIQYQLQYWLMQNGIFAWNWRIWYLLPWLWIDVAVVVFFLGVLRLTAPEHYPPADRADATLRSWVRISAAIPVVAFALFTLQGWMDYRAAVRGMRGGYFTPLMIVGTALLTVGCVPLPFMIFYRLRGLAKRARSAHLAEHCMIVGIGASISLIYIGCAWLVLQNGDEWFGDYWTARSNSALVIMTVLGTLSLLFILWSLYLLIRFAIAFGRARRQMRSKWAIDDRAMQ